MTYRLNCCATISLHLHLFEAISATITLSLHIYKNNGYYNIAGELPADEDNIEYSGVDIVRFGKDINQILYRKTLSNSSLIYQYEKTIEIFERYYQY